jgi:hypothetical protein
MSGAGTRIGLEALQGKHFPRFGKEESVLLLWLITVWIPTTTLVAAMCRAAAAGDQALAAG